MPRIGAPTIVTKQPTQPRLNYAHPLARGLSLVFHPEVARQTDFFGGKFTSTANTLKSDVNGRSQTSSVVVTSTKTLNWGGGITVLAIAVEPAADTDYMPIIAGGNLAGTAGFWMGHSFATHTPAVSNNSADVSCGPASLDKPVVQVGTASGTSITGWLNGIKGSTTALTTNGSSVAKMFLENTNVSTSAYTGSVALVLFWNRVLTDAEIIAVSANPWQLFKAQSADYGLLVSGAAPTDQIGQQNTSDDLVTGDQDTLTQEGIFTDQIPTQDAGNAIEALQGHLNDQLDELFSDDAQAFDQVTQDLNGFQLTPADFVAASTDALGVQDDTQPNLSEDDDYTFALATQDDSGYQLTPDSLYDPIGLNEDLSPDLSDDELSVTLATQDDSGYQPIPADVVVVNFDLQGHQSDQLEANLTDDDTDSVAQEPTSGFLISELFDGIGIQSYALEGLFSQDEDGTADLVAQELNGFQLTPATVEPDLIGQLYDQLEALSSQDEDGTLDLLVTENSIQITPDSYYDAIGYQSDQLEELFSDEQVANDNLTTALTDAQMPNNVIVLAVIGVQHDTLETPFSRDEDGTLEAILYEFWQPYPIDGTAPTSRSTQANRKYGGVAPNHFSQAPRGIQPPRGTLKRFR